LSQNANEPAAGCEIVCRNMRPMHDLRGWNQQFLGKRVGLGQGTISGIERVERCPSVQGSFRLPEAFGTKVERIVGGFAGDDEREGRSTMTIDTSAPKPQSRSSRTRPRGAPDTPHPPGAAPPSAAWARQE